MKVTSNGKVERQTPTESVDAADTAVHKTVAVRVRVAEVHGEFVRKEAAPLLSVEAFHAGFSIH
jgi:hypothetical protein